MLDEDGGGAGADAGAGDDGGDFAGDLDEAFGGVRRERVSVWVDMGVRAGVYQLS